MTIRRGEIWWADVGARRGAAPAHRRPVLIVQADRYNESRLQTVVAVVLTSNVRLAAMPGNVLLPADLARLPDDSVADVTQVVTLDRRSLDARVGELPRWLVDQVDVGLRRVLSL